MSFDPLGLALVLVFVAVAIMAGLAASVVLSRSSPERRRLREMVAAGGASLVATGPVTLADRPDAVSQKISSFVPKSPKEMGRLQRRMVRGGFKNPGRAAVIY